MQHLLDVVLVFSMTAVSDAVWTYYIQASASQQRAKAVLASGIIVLLGSLITLEVVANRWLLVPTVAGAMVGTFVTMTATRLRGGDGAGAAEA